MRTYNLYIFLLKPLVVFPQTTYSEKRLSNYVLVVVHLKCSILSFAEDIGISDCLLLNKLLDIAAFVKGSFRFSIRSQFLYIKIFFPEINICLAIHYAANI